MLDLKVTTVNKAKNIISDEKRKSIIKRKKTPVILEYESYLKRLERGKAITITLKESDKFQTIKYRLRNAAGNLGIKNIKIERAGDKVIVYREIKPRARRAAKPAAISSRKNREIRVEHAAEDRDAVELESSAEGENQEWEEPEYRNELSYTEQNINRFAAKD